ncbi:MAG: putative baseplate assembly protein, partial [Chloroflexota bacterium]
PFCGDNSPENRSRDNMALPEPILDDLQFQRDLVDEARRRIIRYCPEWTDYNLSDPGITLIELFAWMTELIVYRLNRVPEKNYIKFMELIGIHLQPASSAHTELTFWLSAPFPLGPEDTTVAVVPQGIEVATVGTDEAPEIIFTTDQRLTIIPPRLTQLRRDADFQKNYWPLRGIEFYAFDQNPKQGDTFYLGFDETQNLSGHILRLTFDCEATQATGVRREDPPWVWECSTGNGQWQEIPLNKRPTEKDTTGGLNNPHGSFVLYLPLAFEPDQVRGRTAYWLRCRFETRRTEQGAYSESPRILNVQAHALGATTVATHARFVHNEELGLSSGEAGQSFKLQHAPLLALQPGETIEIEENHRGEVVYAPWQAAPNFSQSSRYDRHFTLETASGEINFGPAVRQRNGEVKQYGRIPEAGRRIRFRQYRYGGGVVGNAPAGKLQVMRSAIPYIDRVTNFQPAAGGRDPESLAEAKLRLPQELRAQQRAVTAEDFENLGKAASRSVARLKCIAPGNQTQPARPGAVELLVVPAAAGDLRQGRLSGLELEPDLRKRVLAHLDQYRLLTTNLIVREPHYIGVKVQAQIVVSEYSQPEVVRERAWQRLQGFISPLALGLNDEELAQFIGSSWEGWPFGRSLYLAELYSLLQQTPGVKHVLEVQLSQRRIVPNQEAGPGPASEQALTPLKDRALPLAADQLLCSLDHEIEIVEV